MRGVFVVFEGVDCSGKSTQVKLFRDYLERKSEVQVIQFPDRETVTGYQIEKYLHNPEEKLEETSIHLLFSANRWEKAKEIVDLTNRGCNVVCDSYAYSGCSYSSAKTSKKLSREWCKTSDAGLPRPDVVFYLDIDSNIAASRTNEKKEFFFFRHENVEFLTKVRKEFQQFVREEDIFLAVDASRSAEEVHSEIRSLFEKIEPTESLSLLWPQLNTPNENEIQRLLRGYA